MSFGGDSVNVYAEAKTEYTRQLCQNLTPAFHIYFLDLFKYAKENTKEFLQVGWDFQELLQEIPDWSQDKVLRETEKIIRESRCDYLEELLTAVFIAHTKVLSAIRITTKQKKLQLTIPKLDHFLHRTLRETGRLIWGNTFLFLDEGNSIDRQKNMRQVEFIIQEGIQQSIRSLLPVKTILREYLNDEGEDADGDGDVDEDDDEDDIKKHKSKKEEVKPEEVKPEEVKPEEVKTEEVKTEEVKPEEVKTEEVKTEDETDDETNDEVVKKVRLSKDEKSIQPPVILVPKNGVVSITKEESFASIQPMQEQQGQQEQQEQQEQQVQQVQGPTLVVDTEPSVSFTNMDTVFDSDNPERNAITENIYEDEIETIQTLDLPPEPMDEFEELT